MKICGIACVNDSHAILGASIGHLALNGISDFYLNDHGSDPALVSVLSNQFRSGAVRFHVLRKESRPFFQRAMVAALAELARMDGFEIAVAFDADEFWCSTVEGHTLAAQIALEMSTGVEAVRVPVVNYVQHRDVDTFHEGSLVTCRYSVIPYVDPTLPPSDQVDAGLPFVAMPFPSKVIARLSSDTKLTAGQHSITKDEGEGRITDAYGIVVRHLTLPSRHDVVCKREHGLRLIAAGLSSEIGWQLQRLALMTDGELDAYWSNNSWHLSDDQRVCVGSYDRLVEDDALVQIDRDLTRARDGFRETEAVGADETLPSTIPSRKLERLTQSLVDDFGMADRAISDYVERLADARRQLDERTIWALELDERLRERDERLREYDERLRELDEGLRERDERLRERDEGLRERDERLRERDERLVALTKEFDERSAWALRLNDRLAEADRELAAIKSSTLWRTARVLHLAARPRTSAGS